MIITGKRIITGDGKTIMEGGALYLKNGLIEDIGPVNDLVAKHPEDEIADYGESSILPGLIDMHVHISASQAHIDRDAATPYTIGYNALDFAQRALKSGVTTLRDVSSADSVCQSIIYSKLRGLVDNVPRILHSNLAVCATGGHGWFGMGCRQADGEDEIRKAVREQIRAGAHWIKIMSSHRTDGVSEYTQEELNAATDEARRHKKKTAVHASIQPSLEFAINAGFDTIEHGTDLTLAQIKRMKEKGIAWVPTLLVHHTTLERTQKVLDEKGKLNERQQETYDLYKHSVAVFKKNFKPYAETGVMIVSGTDMIYDNGALVAGELALMSDYGMDNLSVIASGTSVCAKVLGMEGQIGILAKGAAADILIVEGNPAENIKALSDVRAVYFDGKLVN
ncbi:MAG: amidohydrolase family protein [Treponema sp.]|nr:amidohydrolase family protein [Treponema sp.]